MVVIVMGFLVIFVFVVLVMRMIAVYDVGGYIMMQKP